MVTLCCRATKLRSDRRPFRIRKFCLRLEVAPVMDSMAQESSAEVVPPPSCLHPLHLLDQFLDSPATCASDIDSEKNEENRQDKIIRVADYLYGGSILEAALAVLDTDGAIRRVRGEPSNRSLFLVRGARTSKAPADYYICLVEHGITYCSCRSYFERAKADPRALCKHLLALKLLPHLDDCSCIDETIADSEYAKFVLRRVEGGD